jgi:hypothetical protein
MSSYQEWLAAMPTDEIDKRVSQLEGELRVLKQLQALARGNPPLTVRGPRIAEVDRRPRIVATAPGQGRMTPERAAIVDVLRSAPTGLSTAQVVRRLERAGQSKSSTAVAANMSRMVKFGMLERVEQGRYQLPSPTPAAGLLNGHGGGEGGYEP